MVLGNCKHFLCQRRMSAKIFAKFAHCTVRVTHNVIVKGKEILLFQSRCQTAPFLFRCLNWTTWKHSLPSLLRDLPEHFFSFSPFEPNDSVGLRCTVGVMCLFGDVTRLLLVASVCSDIFGICCPVDFFGGDDDDVVFNGIAELVAQAVAPDDVPIPWRMLAEENVCGWCDCWPLLLVIEDDGDLMRRDARSLHFGVCGIIKFFRSFPFLAF